MADNDEVKDTPEQTGSTSDQGDGANDPKDGDAPKDESKTE